MDRATIKQIQKSACKGDEKSTQLVEMCEAVASRIVGGLEDCREYMCLKAVTISPFADDNEECVKMAHYVDIVVCGIYNALKYDYDASVFEGFDMDNTTEQNDDGETEIWFHVKRL
jgi:hypothetical protein